MGLSIFILLAFISAIVGVVLFFTTKYKKAAVALFIISFGVTVSLTIFIILAVQSM